MILSPLVLDIIIILLSTLTPRVLHYSASLLKEGRIQIKIVEVTNFLLYVP